MKKVLSITFTLLLAFLSVIAKADEVPPDEQSFYYKGNSSTISSVCSSSPEFLTRQQAYDWCLGKISTYFENNSQSCGIGATQPDGTSSGGDIYKYKTLYTWNAPSCSNVFEFSWNTSKSTGEHFSCPSTHPVHIDNNSNGEIDSGDMCSTACQEGWQTNQLWGTPPNSTTQDLPFGFCKLVNTPNGVAACKYDSVLPPLGSLPPEVNDGLLWSFPIISTGESCPESEAGNPYGENGFDSDFPTNDEGDDPYDAPEDGDGDNNSDTDPDVNDDDGDGDTSDENLEVIKSVLTEIEDNTDDLELLAKDGNKFAKQTADQGKNANSYLKQMVGLLTQIKDSEGVKNAGGGGGGNGDGNGEDNPPNCSETDLADNVFCKVANALIGDQEAFEDYQDITQEDDGIQEEDFSNIVDEMRYDIDLGQGTCPSNPSFSAFGTSIEIEMSIFCDIADILKTLVIISAWLTALRIYGTIQ